MKPPTCRSAVIPLSSPVRDGASAGGPRPLIRQTIGRGIDAQLGRNYRHAKYKGGEWEDPLSLDHELEDGGTLGGAVAAAGDVETDAVEAIWLAEVEAAPLAHSGDELDEAIARELTVRLAGGGAEHNEALGQRHGRSRTAVMKRRRALGRRALGSIGEGVA